MADFLLEIGCEEIPARMIAEAIGYLRQHGAGLLETTKLLPDKYDEQQQISDFSTPRRLAVIFRGIRGEQEDLNEIMIGPAASVAYKDDAPTKAAEGFAKKAGVPVEALGRKLVGNTEYVQATVARQGKTASAILAEFLPRELAGIPWPKNMYWRKPSERFVRPVRWLVAMLDGEVVPLEFDGIQAGNASRGHRMLSSGAVTLAGAAGYVDALRASKVLGRGERQQQVRKALDAATRAIPGARWREDAQLLDTVVNLTEFPSAILGSFDPQFLELPEDVLVTVMRDHQKYFAVEDASGKLLPHFLTVLNTDGDPQGLIRHGNERVLRARFNDARFFWQTDQKRSLLERLDLLKSVTFQKDLGSYYDKTQRVLRLCSWVSESVKRSGTAIRPGVVHKAACLAKTDLTTELVKEFTELQGIVGGLYARAQQLDDGLPEATRFAIADAIYDHYKPGSTDDSLPRSMEGVVLSLADKADTIAGMFALGLVPTGSKDPFALRRQANAIVKVLAEKKLPLGLTELMRGARAGYKGSEAEKKFVEEETFDDSVRVLFRERMEFYLREVKGYAYDVTNAVLSADASEVSDALARAEAVNGVLHMPEFQAIGAACKRIRNILRQADEKKIAVAAHFESRPDSSVEEKALSEYLAQNGPIIKQQQENRQYREALVLLATARGPVDAFFDKVMVMVEDEKVRANRLALLKQLLHEFSTIADFSEIVTEGK
jgi:glycyl-tRNA synthetase beta chain